MQNVKNIKNDNTGKNKDYKKSNSKDTASNYMFFDSMQSDNKKLQNYVKNNIIYTVLGGVVSYFIGTALRNDTKDTGYDNFLKPLFYLCLIMNIMSNALELRRLQQTYKVIDKLNKVAL